MDKLALAANLTGTIGQSVAGYKAAGAAQQAGDKEFESERIAGEYNAHLVRDEGRRNIAKGRAILGTAGVVLSSGTPLDIMLESAKQAELEALAVQREHEVRGQTARQRGRIAGMEKGPAIGRGLVRGATYFSDWYNDYGLKRKQTP